MTVSIAHWWSGVSGTPRGPGICLQLYEKAIQEQHRGQKQGQKGSSHPIVYTVSLFIQRLGGLLSLV